MDNSIGPIWVPDAEAPECTYCKVQFGLLTRRHHCRACGGVFCNQCCSQRLRLPDHGFQELVRVCLRCFKENSLEELWEAESFTARYYLRLHAGYSIVSPLFEASRRDAREKSMFLVQDPQGNDYLLTLLSRGAQCVVPYLTSESARGALKRVLLGVRHPYVWPVVEADFLEDRDRAVVLCPFAKRGSLRDLMHRANPKTVFGEKYKRRVVAPLPVNDIALYGRQILEALLYLTSRRFRVAHLHTGNILVDRKCCHVTGLENELLGMSSDLEEKAANVRENVEVLAFGRVLFEMATGQPMRSNVLPRLTERTCVPPFHHVLRQIFMPPGGTPPKLEDLVRLKVFSDVDLVADVRFIHQTPMDAKCQRLLDLVSTSSGSLGEEESDGTARGAERSSAEDRQATPPSSSSQSSRKQMKRRGSSRRQPSEGGSANDRPGGLDSSLSSMRDETEASKVAVAQASSLHSQAFQDEDEPIPQAAPTPPPPPPAGAFASPLRNLAGEGQGVEESTPTAPLEMDDHDALLAAIRNPSARKLRTTGAAMW